MLTVILAKKSLCNPEQSKLYNIYINTVHCIIHSVVLYNIVLLYNIIELRFKM